MLCQRARRLVIVADEIIKVHIPTLAIDSFLSRAVLAVARGGRERAGGRLPSRITLLFFAATRGTQAGAGFHVPPLKTRPAAASSARSAANCWK